MVYKKYIKRGGKKFGPYYFKSVRDKNGKVRSIYLGPDYKEESFTKRKVGKLPILAFCVIFLAILVFSNINFTGFSVLDVENITHEENFTLEETFDTDLHVFEEEVNETFETNITNESEVVLEEPEEEIVGFFEDEPVLGENITEINETFVNESLVKRIVINEPVRVIKNVKLENPVVDLEVSLPAEAEVLKIEDENGDLVEDYFVEDQRGNIVTGAAVVVESKEFNFLNFFRDLFAVTGFAIYDGDEGVIVHINEEVKEVLVEYELPGPTSEEVVISDYKKKVIVSSEIHYENILAWTNVGNVREGVITLYHIEEGKRVDVTKKGLYSLSYVDEDLDGLVDKIEWNVPSLSSDEYEVEITVLNIQSYPTVGGTWQVRFETVGKADLKITAFDGTTWSDSNEDNDLKFLEVKCGDHVLDYEWIDGSVVVTNYECNEIGYERSKVITRGEHNLEFDFGGQKAYAHNYAGKDTGFRVQHGTFNSTASSANYTIYLEKAVDMNHSFLLVSSAGYVLSAPSAGGVTGYIHRPTQLVFQKELVGAGLNVSWFVVEALNDEFFVPDRGEIYLAVGIQKQDNTISGVTDENQVMITYGGHRGGGISSADWEDVFCKVNLTGTTNVTAVRHSASVDTNVTVRYEVVQWNSDYNLYTGETTVSTAPTTALISGSGAAGDATINMDRSFILANWWTPSNGIRQVQTIYNISNTNEVTFTSYATGYSNLVRWYVIESPVTNPFYTERFAYYWDPSPTGDAYWKENDITIPVNVSSAFVRHSMSVSGTGTAFRRDFELVELVNSTTWRATQYYSATANYDAAYVASSVVALPSTNVFPNSSWADPTPADEEVLTETYAYLNTSINDIDDSSAFFDWNGSLIGYWSFESLNNPFLVHDNSTWGHTATYYLRSNYEVVPGVRGNAMFFNGTVDDSRHMYVDADLSERLNQSQALTVEAWAYLNDSKTADQHVQTRSAQYQLYYDQSSDAWAFRIYNSSTSWSNSYFSQEVPNLNQWYHLAGVWNGTEVMIYVDGVKGSVTAESEDIFDQDATSNFIIGTTGTSGFKGSIDEAKLWDRALSEEEINASWNNSAYPLYHNFTNLVGGLYNYTLYVVDSKGNLNISDTREVTTPIDESVSPQITINSPIKMNYSTEVMDFNISASEALSNCNVSIDGFLSNETMLYESVNTIWNFTNESMSDGQYVVNFSCEDLNGNLNMTEGREFGIDNTNPVLVWDDPTPAAEESITDDFVYLNTSVTESTNTSAFFDWNGSLIGYWGMDEHNSTHLYDNSSNVNHGNFSIFPPTSGYVPGKYGWGLEFDGGWYVKVPSLHQSPTFQDSFTVSLWVKANHTGDIRDIIGTTSTITGSQGWVLKRHSDNKFRFGLHNGSDDAYVEVNSISASSAGQWYHLVGVFDNPDDEIRLYVDGNLQGTTGTTSFNFTHHDARSFDIGGISFGSNRFFNGTLDEVMFFDRALSEEEINASYSNSGYRLENNFTSLGDSLYNYTAYVIDEAGNLNVTNLRNVTLGGDIISPEITIDSPNATNYSSLSIDFNITSNEALSNCNVSIDGFLSNETMLYESVNTIWNFTNESMDIGTYWANFSCEDLNGNMNMTEGVFFGVDPCKAPASDDWNISIECNLTDETVYIADDYDLNILNGGKLNLDNAKIYLDGASDGNSEIHVYSGGEFNATDGSNITSDNPGTYEYVFIADSGSTFGLESSSVEHIGYGTSQGQRGLEINGTISKFEGSSVWASFYALSLYSSDNVIYNNTFNMTSGTGARMSLYMENAAGNNISSNIFATASGGTLGSDVFNIDNSTLEYNYFWMDKGFGGTSNYALKIAASENVTLIENNITTPDDEQNFQLKDCSNVNLTSNILDGGTAATEAIHMVGANNSYFSYNNATITSSGDPALYIINSDNNTFEWNNFSGGMGAKLDLALNHTFTSDVFEGSTSNGARFIRADNLLFVDSTFVSGNNADIYTDDNAVGPSNSTFLNCTYDDDEVILFKPGTIFEFKWSLEVYVNDTGGNPVESATVTGENNSELTVFTETTEADGFIITQNLTEVVKTFSVNQSYNNYTINASKAGYSDVSTSHNVTGPNQVNLTFGNSAPGAPTLDRPEDTSSIEGRKPNFNWTNASDSDGNDLTYGIEVDNDADFTSPTINVTGIDADTYTPSQDLDFDNGGNEVYYWRVNANDGTTDGAYSAGFEFTLISRVEITMPNSTMAFGSMDIGDTNNTADNSPEPFTIQNDGNCWVDVNLSLEGTGIWDSAPSPTGYFTYKIDNYSAGTDSESNAFNDTYSTIVYTNVPQSNTSVIANLSYDNSSDIVEVDINLTVPFGEPAGAKSAYLWFWAEIGE